MDWPQRYLSAGLTPIPIVEGEKAPPIHKEWQFLSPEDQWQKVSSKANVGLLCGNGFAVADGDTPETVETLANGFTAMGLTEQLTQVKTASKGHLQFYLRVAGVPEGERMRNLDKKIGKGEFRLSGVYVVAPGSTVGERPYQFTNGSPEAYREMPLVQWRDLRWLVPEASTVAVVNNLPVRLIHRSMPERASQLFERLHSAQKGESIQSVMPGIVAKLYRSRSEGEAAIVAMGILAGWHFSEIEEAFGMLQPGHYVEKRQHGRKYLETTYNNVLSWIVNTPQRLVIARAYERASEMGWPGRGGGNDRAVMLALLAISWQFGSYQIHASLRDIMQHASIDSLDTAKTATDRLYKAGLVSKKSSANRNYGSVYDLTWLINTTQYPYINQEKEPPNNCDLCTGIAEETWDIAEVWSPGNLGKVGGLYYALSRYEWGHNSELGKQLGKDPRTVQRWGRRLAEKGLVVSENGEEKKWKQTVKSLSEVANEMNTEGRALRRQQFYEDQRLEQMQWLTNRRERHRKGKENES